MDFEAARFNVQTRRYFFAPAFCLTPVLARFFADVDPGAGARIFV
jgi:hypothetical protein